MLVSVNKKGSEFAQIMNLSNLLYHLVYFGQVKSCLIAQNPQGFFLGFKKIEKNNQPFVTQNRHINGISGLFALSVHYRGGDGQNMTPTGTESMEILFRLPLRQSWDSADRPLDKWNRSQIRKSGLLCMSATWVLLALSCLFEMIVLMITGRQCYRLPVVQPC